MQVAVKAGGSCRDGFGGAIRQFRNPTKSCGWSEQLMQVKAGGSCRDGFGGASRQFRNPTKSCGWKAKGARSEQLMQVWKLQGRFWRCYPSVSEPYKKLWLEGQGSQERTANAGESRWKLQGRFWRCYPSVSEPYKKLRLGQEPVEAAERVLEVLSGSFETLQKAVAGRPREPGASS